MEASEVNSQVMGCRVISAADGEAVVVGFTTGEVPELFLRWADGRTAWVKASQWLFKPAGEPMSGEAMNRVTVPRIHYVEKATV